MTRDEIDSVILHRPLLHKGYPSKVTLLSSNSSISPSALTHQRSFQPFFTAPFVCRAGIFPASAPTFRRWAEFVGLTCITRVVCSHQWRAPSTCHGAVHR
jgi:hypothetical protein